MKYKYYAAYGGNMNLEQMQRRCPAAEWIGVGVVKDYALNFCSVATIRQAPGESVPIVLWKITDKCEWSLDCYEGFPRLYMKKEVLVEVQGEEVKAMLYILNPPYCNTEVAPHMEYLETIKTGYEQNGIDTEKLLHFAGQ